MQLAPARVLALSIHDLEFLQNNKEVLAYILNVQVSSSPLPFDMGEIAVTAWGVTAVSSTG